MRVYIYIHMNIYICSYGYVHMRTYLYACIHALIDNAMCSYIYIFIYIYMYIYIYREREIDRQRERERYKKKEYARLREHKMSECEIMTWIVCKYVPICTEVQVYQNRQWVVK